MSEDKTITMEIITFVKYKDECYEVGEIIKHLLNKLDEKNTEIERLNNIRNKAIDFLKKNACIDEDARYFCDDLRYDDCNILLDILEGDDKE